MTIPIIDIGGASYDSGNLSDTGREIVTAAREVGFFYVENHGIARELREACLAGGADFFDAPLDLKLKYAVNRKHRGYVAQGAARMYGKEHPDLKESFKWALEFDETEDAPLYGANQWPVEYPAFAKAAYAYFLEAMRCGDFLLQAVAVGLGLRKSFFVESYGKPISRGGIIHYPPQDPMAPGDVYGVAPHTDYGCLTLLWQDDSGGLHIRTKAGDWIDAEPIEDTYVINIGDLLARWTNDLLASNAHRVVNLSGRDRYSIVVFHDPSFSTVVDPGDVCPGQPSTYPPVTAGEYVLERFNEAFTYRA